MNDEAPQPPTSDRWASIRAILDFFSHAILTIIAMFVIPYAALEHLAPEWRTGATPSVGEWVTLWSWWAAATWVGGRSTVKAFNNTHRRQPGKPVHPLVVGPVFGASSIWLVVLVMKDATIAQRAFVVVVVGGIATISLFAQRWRSAR